MAGVHPDGSKILAKQPTFSATDAAGHPDGRPNEAAMAEIRTQQWGQRGDIPV
jgi:hypothetical protein